MCSFVLVGACVGVCVELLLWVRGFLVESGCIENFTIFQLRVQNRARFGSKRQLLLSNVSPLNRGITMHTQHSQMYEFSHRASAQPGTETSQARFKRGTTEDRAALRKGAQHAPHEATGKKTHKVLPPVSSWARGLESLAR